MKKIDWIVIITVIFLSFYLLRDLFKPGFYTSHDGPHQIVRLYYFDQALRDGQIPPRIAGGLLNGFGYPLFIFSYQMPWIIAEPFHLLGFSIIDSIKVTFLVGFILSAITMYIYQKEIFGRLAASAGGILYIVAPFRFSNIFVRAALGDATAFIFPPILFLAVYKLKREKRSLIWIILGAISLAGLLLSHAMIFLLFFVSFVIYFGFSLVAIEKKKDYIKKIFLMVILGLGLSAYYLIPSITEKNSTVFDAVMGNAFIGNVFLTVKDLLYSPWGYGMMHAKEGGMSFQVGIAQWLSFVLVILTLLYLRLVKKFDKKNSAIFNEITIFLLLFILSIAAMLPVSLPFWKEFSRLMVIDFPWRILSVTVFLTSILSGFIISRIKWPYIFAFILIFLALYGNRNHLRINKTLDWPLSFYLKLEKTTNSFDEYTPKWVKQEFIRENAPKAEFFPVASKIDITQDKSNMFRLILSATESGNLRINKIYYPGWEMNIDGGKTKIDYPNGLIELPITKGKHKIELQFRETPLRKMADLISLVSLSVVVLGLVKSKKYA